MSARGVTFRPIGPADERESSRCGRPAPRRSLPAPEPPLLASSSPFDNPDFRPSDVVVSRSTTGASPGAASRSASGPSSASATSGGLAAVGPGGRGLAPGGRRGARALGSARASAGRSPSRLLDGARADVLGSERAWAGASITSSRACRSDLPGRPARSSRRRREKKKRSKARDVRACGGSLGLIFFFFFFGGGGGGGGGLDDRARPVRPLPHSGRARGAADGPLGGRRGALPRVPPRPRVRARLGPRPDLGARRWDGRPGHRHAGALGRSGPTRRGRDGRAGHPPPARPTDRSSGLRFW